MLVGILGKAFDATPRGSLRPPLLGATERSRPTTRAGLRERNRSRSPRTRGPEGGSAAVGTRDQKEPSEGIKSDPYRYPSRSPLPPGPVGGSRGGFGSGSRGPVGGGSLGGVREGAFGGSPGLSGGGPLALTWRRLMGTMGSQGVRRGPGGSGAEGGGGARRRSRLPTEVGPRRDGSGGSGGGSEGVLGGDSGGRAEGSPGGVWVWDRLLKSRIARPAASDKVTM